MMRTGKLCDVGDFSSAPRFESEFFKALRERAVGFSTSSIKMHVFVAKSLTNPSEHSDKHLPV